MPVTLVSQTSGREIEGRQLHRAFSRALVQLSANLLRVTRGAGKPEDIVSQAAALVEAARRYSDVAGEPPAADGILGIGVDLRFELEPHEAALIAARDRMIGGALQIVASRLLDQKTQERAGMLEMFGKGKRAFEAALRAQPPLHSRRGKSRLTALS